MECKVTCFERVMNLVQELPDGKLKEGVEIVQEYSFQDFIDFCVDNECFTESQGTTLYEGIVMWENLESNYWEEDYDKLHLLYDAVGLTEEIFEKYTKDEDDGEEEE